jgi:hypothetical protein
MLALFLLILYSCFCLTIELIWILYLVFAFSSQPFLSYHLSHSTLHLQMVRRLKTSHAGATHQYSPQEQYNDFHDGDTDEEIMVKPAPVAAPDLIMVSDDEEDRKEVNPEEGEPADQPNQEEQAPGEDLEDYHGSEVEEEEQEQDEAAEDVI